MTLTGTVKQILRICSMMVGRLPSMYIFRQVLDWNRKDGPRDREVMRSPRNGSWMISTGTVKRALRTYSTMPERLPSMCVFQQAQAWDGNGGRLNKAGIGRLNGGSSVTSTGTAKAISPRCSMTWDQPPWIYICPRELISPYNGFQPGKAAFGKHKNGM